MPIEDYEASLFHGIFFLTLLRGISVSRLSADTDIPSLGENAMNKAANELRYSLAVSGDISIPCSSLKH